MIIAQSYTFSPGPSGQGTITLPTILKLEDFGQITNVTRGSIIYSPVDDWAGAIATVSGGNTTLTLDQTTSYCESGDKLQIVILQGGDSGVASEVTVVNTPLNPVNVTGSLSISGGSVEMGSLAPELTDSFGRVRVSQTFNLLGSNHRFRDNGKWATLAASGGTAEFSPNEGLVNLNVTSASGSKVIRETYRVFPYQPGKGLLSKHTFTMSPAKTNLRQRVGYFNDYNGLFVEKGSTSQSLCFVKRSFVTGSVVDTKISRLGGVYGAGDTGWNVDKLDGNGPSGLTFDSDKSAILFIDLEWLGVGTVCLGFMINRKFVICHRFEHSGIITGTYMTTACLPVRYEIENLGTTASSSTLKQICSTVESEGGFELSGDPSTAGTPLLSPRVLTLADTYYPVIALRLKANFLDSIAILSQIALMGTGNNSIYRWQLVYNPTVVGGSWVSAGDSSSLEYNITATSHSGGRAVSSGFTSSSNQSSSPTDLTKSNLLSYQFDRDGLAGVARPLVLSVAGVTAAQTIHASLDWEEI